MFNKYDVLIVGCGLSGCVIAEKYANEQRKKVLIIDKRDHIGGNCYDVKDPETNILYNLYGPHFFHTNYDDVWEYVNRFAEFIRYELKVVSNVDNILVPVPVNISTVNTLCDQHIKTENEMNEWLDKNRIKYDEITNSEEMACSLVGKNLYEKMFKTYTYKQWNKYPEELRPEIMARIPVRHNFDTRYFDDKYQGLPKNGYTNFFSKLLDNNNIDVQLNTDYHDVKHLIHSDTIIIYTGPIDIYFSDIGYEKLEYRSIKFVYERYKNMNYFQTHAVTNYPGNNVKFTRITEYKHCLHQHQQSSDTIISKEYPCDDGEPYYPVLTDKNLHLYESYKKLANDETLNKNVHFVGRLANYKYFNMDQAIKNALTYYAEFLSQT